MAQHKQHHGNARKTKPRQFYTCGYYFASKPPKAGCYRQTFNAKLSQSGNLTKYFFKHIYFHPNKFALTGG